MTRQSQFQRFVAGPVAVVVLLGALSGCVSAEAAPAPPTTAQLESMVSRSVHLGSDGYRRLGVSLIRFISSSQWASVMTTCVRQRGVTGVDFRNANTPYWTAAPDQGQAALQSALQACSLEYPDAATRHLLLTDAQWAYEFRYLRGAYRSCVQSAGANYLPPDSLVEFLSHAHSFVFSDPITSVSPAQSGLSQRALASRCSSWAPGL